MPTPLDLSYLFLITVVLTVFETLVFFPRFKAAALAQIPGTRVRAYRRGIIAQWVCAAIVVAMWIGFDRSWTDLGLAPSHGLQLWGGIALAVIVVGLAAQQARAIGRVTPERRAQIRPAFASVEFLLPHTRDEARAFMVLSLTAGVCEELVYRGFLVWVLQPYVGVVGAMALGVALFAVGHAYQGKRGILKTAAAGVVMSLIVIGAGWLIPAMVVHAIIDLNAGMLGYAVLDESKNEIAAAA